MAFILSGTLAGLAGSLKMFVTQNASLTDVHWTMSGEVVLMTLVGGLGTSFGPIVGAFIIVAMQQYLASFGQWVMVMQGAVFIICVLTFRRGIIGEIAHYFKRSLLTSRREFQPDDPRDDQPDAGEPTRGRRIAEQHDAEDGGAARADAGPDRLAGSARQRFQRDREQDDAERHRGKRQD